MVDQVGGPAGDLIEEVEANAEKRPSTIHTEPPPPPPESTTRYGLNCQPFWEVLNNLFCKLYQLYF